MKVELEGLRRKASEYFEQCGYVTKLNSEAAGLSGVLHKVDVLAVDKRFSEVRIACRCQACTSPVDEDSILSWVKICEDIRAVPALASTTNYTDSALKAAKKFGFILLIFDEQSDSILKVGIKSDFLEDSRVLVYRADKALNRAEELLSKLGDQFSKEESEESKKISSEVKSLCREAESLYKKALEQKPNKDVWLKLGNLYSSDLVYYLPGNTEKYKKEAIRCYVNALKEHIKDFSVPLKKLGSETLRKFELQQEIEELFNVTFVDPLAYTLFHSLRFRRIEHFQISLLKMYLERYPKDVDAWLNLSKLYITIGRLSNSEKACKKALEIDPNNPRVLSRASTLYCLMAEGLPQADKRREFLEKAIQLQRKCCELKPNLQVHWRNLAEIYERKRDFDSAIKCMEEAIKRREIPHWSMWEKLGDLYI